MKDSGIEHLVLIEKILAHDINVPFTREIREGLSLILEEPLAFDDDWIKGTNEDTSIIRLKREYGQLSAYLCSQVHLLNLLSVHYGFKNGEPFIQLDTSSVLGKIRGNPFTKHEWTPFKGEILKGFNHGHIELFSFNHGRKKLYEGKVFESLKAKEIEAAEARLKNIEDPLHKEIIGRLEATKIARNLLDEIDQNVCKKEPTASGKVTGPWLISETNNNGEQFYLCITPHGSSKYKDEFIKSIIEKAKAFKS